MKRIIFLFLCINQSVYAAAGNSVTKYERSREFRRDYTDLIQSVLENTGEPFKLSMNQVRDYAERHDEKYKCTWPKCSKPLGKMKNGMSIDGLKGHLGTHLGVVYKCTSCENTFPSYAKCYNHIAECPSAPIPQVRTDDLANDYNKDRKRRLVDLIQKERKKSRKKEECLICSLASHCYMAFSRESLEYHKETAVHKELLSRFQSQSGGDKELQKLYTELNEESSSDCLEKSKQVLEQAVSSTQLEEESKEEKNCDDDLASWLKGQVGDL